MAPLSHPRSSASKKTFQRIADWLETWASPVRRKPRKSRSFRPTFEVLESRIAPAAVSWSNPGSGNWDVATNWSSGAVPASTDQVTISPTSAATITIKAGDNITIQQLTTNSNGTLSFTGGSLTIANTTSLNSTLSVAVGYAALDWETRKDHRVLVSLI